MKLSPWDAFWLSLGLVLGGIWGKLRRAGCAVLDGVTRDGVRVLGLVAAASGMLAIDEPLARALHRPELAPWLMFAGLALYGAALSHVLRRVFFPYVDLKVVALEARKGSTGAGLVFLGVCIVLAVVLAMMTSVARADPLPERARQYIPILKAEQQSYWADMPRPAVLAAQVEQETCPSLKHRMCWSPRAELRTSRERGVGLGQITKTARFDALSEMRASYKQELADWSWDDDSIYDPKLQLRALVLKDYQTWRLVLGAPSSHERLAMTLAAYNGGLGGLSSDRKLCGATNGCDKSRWFGHVERTSLKAKAAVSGYGKSFFEINREYPRNILGPRLGKYEGLL